jgi:hypothetical protein
MWQNILRNTMGEKGLLLPMVTTGFMFLGKSLLLDIGLYKELTK